jgi:putative membrane protein
VKRGENILMWFGWGFFFIPICLIFGAIVIYYLIISSRNNCHTHYTPRYTSNTNTNSASRAREIIAERYARGEITKEEFIEMKKELDR